ncbi:hypothetical protein D9611_014606 [Ephemerocybe angulata]|uniref:Uncharacterized protein n=1 Tax=Ephemerocybe angulata TaxID=980116 RepID=A0A8H5FJ14_9AGAR|nr:hypothetical protein D9611_014606 [Tulosesus angulatus]
MITAAGSSFEFDFGGCECARGCGYEYGREYDDDTQHDYDTEHDDDSEFQYNLDPNFNLEPDPHWQSSSQNPPASPASPLRPIRRRRIRIRDRAAQGLRIWIRSSPCYNGSLSVSGASGRIPDGLECDWPDGCSKATKASFILTKDEVNGDCALLTRDEVDGCTWGEGPGRSNRACVPTKSRLPQGRGGTGRDGADGGGQEGKVDGTVRVKGWDE